MQEAVDAKVSEAQSLRNHMDTVRGQHNALRAKLHVSVWMGLVWVRLGCDPQPVGQACLRRAPR